MDPEDQRRLSVASVLGDMPKVFTGAEFANKYALAPNHARVTLHRWLKRGWLAHLESRSDVYYNMQRFPQEDWRYDALLYSDPGVVFNGMTALQHAGWSTQIAQQPTMASVVRSFKNVAGFSFVKRDISWYDIVAPHLQRTGGIPYLQAPYALVDALCKPDDQWLPDPDDLDWFEIDSDENRSAIVSAINSLGEHYRIYAHRTVDTLPLDRGVEDWYVDAYHQAKSPTNRRRRLA